MLLQEGEEEKERESVCILSVLIRVKNLNIDWVCVVGDDSFIQFAFLFLLVQPSERKRECCIF